MNWLELYNKVILKVWGLSAPPANFVTAIQGINGIIANAHRKIQQDFNYWFMEAETTITLADGTKAYALPADFKEVYPRGLRLQDLTTGDYNLPLSPLYPNEAYEYFRDSDQEQDYPVYYEIFGGQVLLYPTPGLDNVLLYVRYYKYLDRPLAFDTTYDDLTTHGYEAITNLAAAEIEEIMEEYQKSQAFMAKALNDISILQDLDSKMRRAELNTCKYVGL